MGKMIIDLSNDEFSRTIDNASRKFTVKTVAEFMALTGLRVDDVITLTDTLQGGAFIKSDTPEADDGVVWFNGCERKSSNKIVKTITDDYVVTGFEEFLHVDTTNKEILITLSKDLSKLSIVNIIDSTSNFGKNKVTVIDENSMKIANYDYLELTTKNSNIGVVKNIGQWSFFNTNIELVDGKFMPLIDLDGTLITRDDATRYLINSTGDNVAANTGVMKNFDGVSHIDYGFIPEPYQQQSIRATVNNLDTTVLSCIVGAGYSSTSAEGCLSLATQSGKVKSTFQFSDGTDVDVFSTNSSGTDTASYEATIDAENGISILYRNGLEDGRAYFTPQTIEKRARNFMVGAFTQSDVPAQFATGNIGNIGFFQGIRTKEQILIDYLSPEMELKRLLSGKYNELKLYEKEVKVPKYNSLNTTHKMVYSTDWNNIVLNDLSINHFYLVPGEDYSTRLTLTVSGIDGNNRSISLYNGNDIHPEHLPISNSANISLDFDGASYWHLDRVSNYNGTGISFVMKNGSSNNIINRAYLKDFYYGIVVNTFCNNNTVQNSFLDTQTLSGRQNDGVGLAIGTDAVTNATVASTSFVYNKIKNANDGIHLLRPVGQENLSYFDTKIYGNTIWSDETVRSNNDYATNGYDPAGEYNVAIENAIDIKVGSLDLDKPNLCAKNIMYGYRKNDETANGSTSLDNGLPMVVHFGCANTVIEENLFYNCISGILMGDPRPGSPYGGVGIIIRKNIFSNIGIVNPSNASTFVVSLTISDNILVEENVFNNIQYLSGHGALVYIREGDAMACTNVTVRRNVFIGTGVGDYGNDISNVYYDNYYYKCTNIPNADTNPSIYSLESDANMEATTLFTDRSNSLKNTKTTSDSPHNVLGLEDLSISTKESAVATPLISDVPEYIYTKEKFAEYNQVLNSKLDVTLSGWINNNSFWTIYNGKAYHALSNVLNTLVYKLTNLTRKKIVTFSIDIVSGTVKFIVNSGSGVDAELLAIDASGKYTVLVDMQASTHIGFCRKTETEFYVYDVEAYDIIETTNALKLSNGLTNGIQKISLNEDMTLADGMHFDVSQPDQSILTIHTRPYAIEEICDGIKYTLSEDMDGVVKKSVDGVESIGISKINIPILLNTTGIVDETITVSARTYFKIFDKVV